MGRVCKSFEVHAKKKKKDYVAVGGLLDVILERAQGKKKKRCVEKPSIFLGNTETHMYRMLIEIMDIKGNSDEASEMRRSMLLEH